MKDQRKDQNNLFFAEHMEEDDPTPRALPRWVELEYKVSEQSTLLKCLIIQYPCNIAHALARRTHRVHSLHESLERDKRLSLRCLFRFRFRFCFSCSGAGRMPQAGRAGVNEIARYRYPPRARMPTRSQGLITAHAIRRGRG